MLSKMLAVVKNGKIEPLEPINFPEGTQLIVTLNLSAEADQDMEKVKENPWLATASSLANDPFFEEYIAEIDRYRQEVDQEARETEDEHIV